VELTRRYRVDTAIGQTCEAAPVDEMKPTALDRHRA